MTKLRWTISGLGLAAFLVVFWAVAARHQTPAGQARLAEVTRQSLPQLKQEFNASPGSERVLLLLSPTCPVCLEGTSRVDAMLKSHPNRNIRVLAIWEPILPTDWSRPTNAALNRLSDPRVAQWWDKQHVVAGLLNASHGTQDPGCCRWNGTLWDVIAVYPPGVRWDQTLPPPKLFAGPVVRGAPQWNAKILQ